MSRPLRTTTAAVALAVLTILAVAGCNGGIRSGSAPGPEPSDASAPDTSAPDTPPVTVPRVDVAVGSAELASPAPGATEPPAAVRQAVAATVRRWVREGIAAGLARGRPGARVANAFTAGAAGRLEGPDRGVLVDEGTWAEEVDVRVAPLDLLALAGPGGSVGVVVVEVTVDARLRGRLTTGGRVTRSGTLTLVSTPEGWRIDAYRLDLTRALPPTTLPEGQGPPR